MTASQMQGPSSLTDCYRFAAIFTEVYSPLWNNATKKFDIGDLGAISPTGTEGDAVQLWSYAFLAALDPRTGKAVAGGF